MNIQLTEDYRITSDKLNIILEERYEKRLGKGKNAPLSGEYDYDKIAYFRDLRHLANYLVKRSVINADVDSLYKISGEIVKLKEEIANNLVDKIMLSKDTVEDGE